jgi:hypothetical protein
MDTINVRLRTAGRAIDAMVQTLRNSYVTRRSHDVR